ncbi:MAG: poly(A) polymerase [Oceanospirillaceae bacterium]|nr:poly(A) polymerase [Oceanospirillaceae bacterium]
MPGQLAIIPRDEHGISRSNISDNALKVLYRLHKAGYQALLVGGGVRDTLLGMHPKDFDVATDATPEQVNKLFRNSRLIGRRFKLVHVIFGRDVIEVATFRAPPQENHSKQQAATGSEGMILRDNVYGTRDEDALRRDFTVNALYYNIADFSVLSYAGGWQDLQQRTLRLIGDPETRYREDPVRMIRAIRFMGKLDFDLSPETAEPVRRLAPLLEQVPSARLFDESLKLFLAGHAASTFELMREYQLFGHLFPAASECIEEDDFALELARNTMKNTDLRIQADKSVTPYFFLSALLWPAVLRMQRNLESKGMDSHPALHKAIDSVMAYQCQFTAIPRRFTISMREVWELQLRLPKIRSRKCRDLLGHPRFRAAYDFLLLREQSGEDLNGLGQWWTDFQQEHGVPEKTPSSFTDKTDRPPRRRRPNRPRRRKPSA